MSVRVQKLGPTGWGIDPLTAYLDDYRDNQFATFANKTKEVRDLIAVDSMLQRLVEGFKDPKPLIPSLLLLRSHSAYRAATGAVLAGQLNEAQALMRLCLEHAAYGHYIGSNFSRAERWLRRDESVINKKIFVTSSQLEKLVTI